MPVARTFRKNGFTFRQFFVAHDKCGMKVSTDGIILGAGAPLPVDGRALDIGSGSGLISLMLAQRLHAQGRSPAIDAIELEAAAVEQSRENIAESPWPGSITVHHADILHWCVGEQVRYSVIVSNPPFYTPGPECRDTARQTARYTHTLTHEALLLRAKQLITADGLFCVILPAEAGPGFMHLAETSGWHLRQQLKVTEYEQKAPHRFLLTFSPSAAETVQQTLVIRAPSGNYSDDYQAMTGEFYLPKPRE